jgi:hypothetical protein
MNTVSDDSTRPNIKMERIDLPKQNDLVDDATKVPISIGNVRNIQGL